ncbi:MAG: hypothetical protein DRI30_00185 [Chloroflexi bacterium]|nr:MAG: hypothetical protein DRI30_00185 [Chloroflexota bacterium]
MEYIQDETTHDRIQTHPPETKEEAELFAEQEKADVTNEKGEAASESGKAASESEEGGDEEPKNEAGKQKEASSEEETSEETVDDGEVVPEVDGGIKVPKDRFDEVNTRMKKAEEKVEALEAKQAESEAEIYEEPEPEPYDYKSKENEAMEAMLEGDSEKYSAINAEIRAAEKAELVYEAKKLAAQGDQQVRESLTFEEAGAKIEEDFPQFAQNNENYNEEAREELLDLYVGYAQSGTYSRVQALQRAAKQAARNFGLTAISGKAVDDETVSDNVVTLKPTDVRAKAKVANAQPPNMESRAKGSVEEPRRDFNSMSDEEFETLPESTKRRARGDFL